MSDVVCGQLPIGGCGNPDLTHLGPCTPTVGSRVKARGGRQGTVVYVESDGVAYVNYDDGGHGSLTPGVDTFQVIDRRISKAQKRRAQRTRDRR